jgi:hypothetical protein
MLSFFTKDEMRSIILTCLLIDESVFRMMVKTPGCKGNIIHLQESGTGLNHKGRRFFVKRFWDTFSTAVYEPLGALKLFFYCVRSCSSFLKRWRGSKVTTEKQTQHFFP